MRLEEHLARKGIKGYEFANESGVPKTIVYRHLQGGRVTYQSAKQMSEATGGEVSIPEIMEPAEPAKRAAAG